MAAPDPQINRGNPGGDSTLENHHVQVPPNNLFKNSCVLGEKKHGNYVIYRCVELKRHMQFLHVIQCNSPISSYHDFMIQITHTCNTEQKFISHSNSDFTSPILATSPPIFPDLHGPDFNGHAPGGTSESPNFKRCSDAE